MHWLYNLGFIIISELPDEFKMQITHTPATLHVFWPGYVKYFHEFVTLIPGSLAEGSARHGHLAVHDAHWGINGAQEHPQIRAAHQVHHGMERLRRTGGTILYFLNTP